MPEKNACAYAIASNQVRYEACLHNYRRWSYSLVQLGTWIVPLWIELKRAAVLFAVRVWTLTQLPSKVQLFSRCICHTILGVN